MDHDAFRAALVYAGDAHHRQCRKGCEVPYVTHAADVAESLAYYYPKNTALALAGLLHDVVEDTSVTQSELTERFGAEVTGLVMAVTKPGDPRLSFHEKRRATLDALKPERQDVLRLKAADALSNLRAIRRDLSHVGERAWGKFKATKAESLGYYRDILARVRAGIGGEPLVGELGRELREVERLSP
jgi:(p)ppGpp synthase/HD superfamily hydrolase